MVLSCGTKEESINTMCVCVCVCVCVCGADMKKDNDEIDDLTRDKGQGTGLTTLHYTLTQ